MYTFQVPEEKKIRVIIDTDAHCEADDQYAIVHGLLTPKFMIKGLVAAHNSAKGNPVTMEGNFLECQKIVQLMSLEDEINIVKGAGLPIDDDGNYEYSDGAKLIVEEAMKEDEAPLFVVFLGPITDLACAYLHSPEIAGRLTVIWIGGGPYPEGGANEFNMGNDINAANIIFKSDIELWQVPMNIYCRVSVSLAELQQKVAPYGKIGKYLYEQLLEVNDYHGARESWTCGESWNLGDSPTIGFMMYPQHHYSEMREAPFVDKSLKYHFDGTGRQIRVYNNIDPRFIIEDFFTKLQLTYGKE